MKNMEGFRSTHWQLQDGHGDVRYSLENIVKNIVIAVYGVRWVRDLSGRSLSKLGNV